MESFVHLWPTLTWVFTAIILLNACIMFAADDRAINKLTNKLLKAQGVLFAIQLVLTVAFFICKASL